MSRFAVGAGVGALMGAGFLESGYGNAGGLVLLAGPFGGIGAAMGAEFDALVKDKTTLYERPGKALSVGVTPLVSNEGAGRPGQRKVGK